MSTANLLDCPTYKLDDRREIITRVIDALFADPDCRYEFHGPWSGSWTAPNHDQVANWEARELLLQIRRTFPTNLQPPPAEVEPLNTDTVDNSTEA